MRIIQFILEKSKVIGLVAAIGAIIHMLLKKYKWQYYPLYLLGVLYFVLIMLTYFKLLKINPRMANWVIVIGIFLIVSSLFFNAAFSKEKLPIPSGNFKVGSTIYDLEDQSRDEIYIDKENANRKLKYQIWYPIDKTAGHQKAKWVTEGTLLTRNLGKSMHVPGFMLDQTAEVYSNSYVNAPISSTLDSYPIVIISHGWKGFRELHTDFAEELASNGFIAISIDHTYGSQAVKFDNGEVAFLNRGALPRIVTPSKFNTYANKLTTTYGEDVISVINDLENINKSKQFYNKLNLDSIGVLGHSTGGGGDVYAALKDKRIKALMGLDAWVNPLKPENLNLGLSIPSLFLKSEQWSKRSNDKALDKLVKNSKDVTLIQLNETKHVDFTMTYMVSPLTKYVGFTGKSGGRYASEIQREFMVDFFGYHLKSKEKTNNNYLKEIVDKYENLDLIFDN